MRILIYGLNYAPELTGVGVYTGELAAWLAARGHEVRVVTSHSYYPHWYIPGNKRNWQYRVERGEGAADPTVYRCPLFLPRELGKTKRVLHLASYALTSIPAMMMQASWRPELIFAVEPTFFAAPMALLSAALMGAKAWLHVQDLEIEAAFHLEILPVGGALQWIANGVESFFNRGFSRVSTISDKMAGKLVEKGVKPGKVLLFPNWVDVDMIRPAQPGSRNPYRNKLSLGDKIVFLYSGTMGFKQGLEALAPLAEAFAHDSRVHFVFCGDGVFRPRLMKLVARLRNVSMLPLQSPNRFNELLNVADIHLLPQGRNTKDFVMPSKLGGMLASGRPVLAMADSDTQVALILEGRGLIVPPSDASALVVAARRMVDDAELRAQFGKAGREYAVENLSKERVLRRFEQNAVALVTPATKGKDVPLAPGLPRLTTNGFKGDV